MSSDEVPLIEISNLGDRSQAVSGQSGAVG